MHKTFLFGKHLPACALFLACALATSLRADTTNPIPVLQIKANRVVANVSPMLYGLMTEEISHSYDGGLYAELIRNRTFKANPNKPVFWNVVGNGSISLDTNNPLNAALNVSLKLDTSKATKNSPVGIANGGYWGIPVRPHTTYRASFYAKGKDFKGPLTVSLVHVVNNNDATINVKADNEKNSNFEWHLGEFTETLASATVPKISKHWRKYEVTLTTGAVEPSKENRLIISTTQPGTFRHKHGTVWFQQVSLFPPTWDDRPNGNRIDLMQMLADLHPAFLRFPGGNYLEGHTISNRFDWEKTIGDISQRPGHRNDAWGYWSTDGMGLLEFLEWCEDLHMQPVLGVYAGYSLDHHYIKPGPDLKPYVQSALEEIQYITGDTNTVWGAQRAKDGHPAPFALKYVEVGNEDWFDRSGSYNGRFAQFYDAIKAEYPNLKVIATAKVTSRVPDLIDEHYYRNEVQMEAQSHMYDSRPRGKTKVFVGEWATHVGSPTTTMGGALGDASWMCCMERNSDLVVMSCYAPLLVNVNTHGWGLIGFNALTCYGSPAYYAQRMFSNHHGDVVLATNSHDIPTFIWQRPARRRNTTRQPRPVPQKVPMLFFDATRDSRSGTIYLKVVNSRGTPQPVQIQISGTSSVAPEGEALVLKADSPHDLNSITAPTNIIPVSEKVDGLGTDFTRAFPPYSITVLELQTR